MSDSLYGSYRTRKFTDLFNNSTDFSTAYKATVFYTNLNRTVSGVTTNEFSDDDITLIFTMLYAKYGNSHIASSDETQFKFKLFMTIFQYGPAWKRRLTAQADIRRLSDSDIRSGTMQINNRALNPDQTPAADAFTPLTYINEQSASGYKKSPLEGYSNLLAILDTDVTEDFISKFKKLFLVVVEPERPLWYYDDMPDPDEEEE